LHLPFQKFSMGERSGLQAGHFSTRILLLRRYDVVIDAVCGLFHMVRWCEQVFYAVSLQRSFF